MAAKKKHESEYAPTKRFVYQGRRYVNGKMFDAFLELTNENTAVQLGEHRWQVKPKRQAFVIGDVYDGKCTDDGSVWFHTFEQVGPIALGNESHEDEGLNEAFDDDVTAWGLLDTADRLRKVDDATEKRLLKDRREGWRECLAPIRRAYQQGNAAERRAIRNLLVDDLLRGD